MLGPNTINRCLPLQQLKRRQFLGLIFVLCFTFAVYSLMSATEGGSLEYERRYNESDFYCDGELFTYQHTTVWNSTTQIHQRGWPFDCSRLDLLRQLKLTQNDTIDEVVESLYPDDLVFVSAANAGFWRGMFNLGYFVSERAAFASVRRHFGPKNRFILYDMGGLREAFGDEISKMCNVELHTFNYSLLPSDVQDFHKFSWKILILAEVFKEATNIIYLDTSIFFVSSNFESIFRAMSTPNFDLTPVQLSGYAGHPFRFATAKDMYNFLPLDQRIQYSVDMFEANLLLIHKCERTRQLLKWAVLCATTLECIDPLSSTIDCDYTRKREIDVCNRQDQSVLNILIRNMEFELRQLGHPTLPRDASEHPISRERRHWVRRCQKPTGNETYTC